MKELCLSTRSLLKDILAKGSTDIDNSYVHSHIEDDESSDGHSTDEHSDSEKLADKIDDELPT